MDFKIKNAVMPIIVANLIFFGLQTFLGRGFTSSFMLVSDDIFTRPWIIVTSMFLHGSPNHLLFNMYALFLFGPFLEQRIGTKRFFTIYFLSGIAASILSSFLYPLLLGQSLNALGASGAIMGMLGVLIIIMPDLKLLLFFIVPMSLRTAGIIWVLIDTFGIFFPSGVANIAHLVGLGTGLIYGMNLKKERRKFDKKFYSKKHLGKDDVEEYLKTGRI
jgi:uncharacterized protein